MNKIPITLTLICLCFIFGGCIGIVIGRATTAPMLCSYWSWDKQVWRYSPCISRPKVRQPRYDTPEPTETPIVYYTATPTPWQPKPYATLTPTVNPYPVEMTPTIIDPYPEPRYYP
jgi:hypothetical protein